MTSISKLSEQSVLICKVFNALAYCKLNFDEEIGNLLELQVTDDTQAFLFSHLSLAFARLGQRNVD